VRVLEWVSDPRIGPPLILEPKTERSARSAGGEQVNLWMPGFAGAGFRDGARGASFLARLMVGCCNPLRTQDGSSRPIDIAAYEGGLTQPE
jgi:hypothetical protein